MKTRIAVVILVISAVNASAQPQLSRGVYSASGSVQFSSSSSKFQSQKMTMSVVSLTPSVALFVLDHLELGFGPSYVYSSSEITPSVPPLTSTATSLGIRLGVRYYFGGEEFAPFAGAEGGLSWSKYSNTSGSPPFSPPTKIFSFQIGVDYFVTQNFALEPSIQYSGMTTATVTDRAFYVSIGVKYFVL